MSGKAKPSGRLGELRVWNIVNVPNEPVHYPVTDPFHAMRLITELAASQLLQPEVTSNVFGLEVFDGTEWLEWENEDGSQIEELRKANG